MSKFKLLLIVTIAFGVQWADIPSVHADCNYLNSEKTLLKCSDDAIKGDFIYVKNGYTTANNSNWWHDFNKQIKLPTSPTPNYTPIQFESNEAPVFCSQDTSCKSIAGINYIVRIYPVGTNYGFQQTSATLKIIEKDNYFYYGIAQGGTPKLVRIYPTTLKGITDGAYRTDWICSVNDYNGLKNGATGTTVYLPKSNNKVTVSCHVETPSGWDAVSSTTSLSISIGTQTKSVTANPSLNPAFSVEFDLANNVNKTLDVKVSAIAKDMFFISPYGKSAKLSLITSVFSVPVTFKKTGSSEKCPDGSAPSGANGDQCLNSCKDTYGTGVKFDADKWACGCSSTDKKYYQQYSRCGPKSCGSGQTAVLKGNTIECQCTGNKEWNGSKCIETEESCEDRDLVLKNGKCVKDTGGGGDGGGGGGEGGGGGDDIGAPGDICSDDSDCSEADSLYCYYGKCACMDGFYLKNGSCVLISKNDCAENGGYLSYDGSCIDPNKTACIAKKWKWNESDNSCTEPDSIKAPVTGGCSLSNAGTAQGMLQLIPYCILLVGLSVRHLYRKAKDLTS